MPDPSLTPDRPEYYVQTGSMFENPYGVPHDEIVSMLLELPAEMAAQVIFGKYVESSGLVFTSELIQMAIDRSLPRVTGDRWQDDAAVAECKVMRHDFKKSRFHGGIDFARKTDYTVVSVIDTRERPARLVYYRRLNRVPWEHIYREVGRAMSIFGPSFAGDSTGMAGDVIFDALDSRRYCSVHDRVFLVEQNRCRDEDGRPLATYDADGRPITCDPGRPGDHVALNSVDEYGFTERSKAQLIEHMRNVLSAGYRFGSDEPFGWLRVPPIVQLEEEWSFYTWSDKGLETDALMSLALACWQGLEDAPAPVSLGSIHGD
jgi:hypothetical protein